MFKLFFKYTCEFDGNCSECEPIIAFFKVSSKTVSEFRDSFIDQFRSDFLGEDWQSGDSGATYQIIEENIILRENDELIKLEFMQKDAKFYLEKNGNLQQVELAEFESVNIISKL